MIREITFLDEWDDEEDVELNDGDVDIDEEEEEF